MSMNKARFKIMGAEYVISTTDSEVYVNTLAERLDTDVRAILEKAPSASIMAATVITAMSYLDELEQKSMALDNMREQIKEYLQEAAKAKSSAEEAVRQAQMLRTEVGTNSLKENADAYNKNAQNYSDAHVRSSGN